MFRLEPNICQICIDTYITNYFLIEFLTTLSDRRQNSSFEKIYAHENLFWIEVDKTDHSFTQQKINRIL